MYLMMAVNVIGKGCKMCPRLKVAVQDEKDNKGQLQERDLECAHYDECLNTVEMYRKGLEDDKTD